MVNPRLVSKTHFRLDFLHAFEGRTAFYSSGTLLRRR